MTVLYDSIWRFFKSIHDYIVGCVVEVWERLVALLEPYIWLVWSLNLVAVLLLLVVLLRGCFQ